VGVQGKRVEAKERKPVHLTFLVDVSGSMSSQDKLPLAQQSLKILTNTLREGDSVALVTYAGNTRVVLPATDAAYKGRILAAIDDLSSGGSTAMSSGMATSTASSSSPMATQTSATQATIRSSSRSRAMSIRVSRCPPSGSGWATIKTT
jgi:Mg-chelatase subunit ChlD